MSDNPKPTVSEIFSRSKDDIVEFLGGIYEHSAWVATELVETDVSAIKTVTDLAGAMKAIVADASRERKLELLCAHPDLCEKVSALKALTKESQEEQSSAGLQSLTEDELKTFTENNNAYREKFQFPFILAVRNATKYTVLAAMKGRVKNSLEVEFAQALAQVNKIAWMRILSKMRSDEEKGFLTCHVLDTANGCPADNMRIHLHKINSEGKLELLGEFITNDDGRLTGGPALKGPAFVVGVYQWTFYVAEYFASKGSSTAGTPFLDVIPLRFGIDNPDDHYHVPLLASPWSFSTYRGS